MGSSLPVAKVGEATVAPSTVRGDAHSLAVGADAGAHHPDGRVGRGGAHPAHRGPRMLLVVLGIAVPLTLIGWVAAM